MSNLRRARTRRPSMARTGWRRRVAAGAAVAAVVAGGTVAAATASERGSTAAALQSGAAAQYSGILVNSSHDSLYLLTIEAGATLHCFGPCLKSWQPITVGTATKSLTKGAGVRGTIGFVKRSATAKQVTFNGYPVYRFLGDAGAYRAKGEGVAADGGTWYLVNAASTSRLTTPVKPKAAPVLTTVTSAPFVHVLANAGGVSLYALTAESAGTLHCTSSCLALWLPVLVATKTTSIPVASGIAGKIGFVTRTASLKQVTFNGFPIYTYTGDTGRAQHSGEGIAADGGTWYLVNAAASTNATTLLKSAPSSTTTTTYYHY